MQQRPRDPEPVAGQPRPRDIAPHWVDGITKLIGYSGLSVIILIAASRGR